MRNALWAALQKAKPQGPRGGLCLWGEPVADRHLLLHRPVDVPVLHKGRQGQGPDFHEGPAEDQPHYLPPRQAVGEERTWEGWFVLWADGKVEMQFLADK